MSVGESGGAGIVRQRRKSRCERGLRVCMSGDGGIVGYLQILELDGESCHFFRAAFGNSLKMKIMLLLFDLFPAA